MATISFLASVNERENPLSLFLCEGRKLKGTRESRNQRAGNAMDLHKRIKRLEKMTSFVCVEGVYS